jgi:hypothetical protein
VKFWLATRQIRHVARHRDAVPAPFAGTVSLAAHQKAADYTIAKSRVGLLEMAWSAAVLLGWTLLGGLHALNRLLLGWLGAGMRSSWRCWSASPPSAACSTCPSRCTRPSSSRSASASTR